MDLKEIQSWLKMETTLEAGEMLTLTPISWEMEKMEKRESERKRWKVAAADLGFVEENRENGEWEKIGERVRENQREGYVYFGREENTFIWGSQWLMTLGMKLEV